MFVLLFRRSQADLWLHTFGGRHRRSSAPLISTPPLVCSRRVHAQRAMKFLHRARPPFFFHNLEQHEGRRGAEKLVVCHGVQKKPGLVAAFREGLVRTRSSAFARLTRRDNIWVQPCQGQTVEMLVVFVENMRACFKLTLLAFDIHVASLLPGLCQPSSADLLK